MQKTLIALSLLLTLSIYTRLHAQENSAYTRYGIGTFNTGAFTNQLSLGGLYSALSNPYALNYANPAALGKLTGTCFQLEAYGSKTIERAKDSSGSFGTAHPAALVLGFPIKKNVWGAAIGVQAASAINYNIFQIASYNYEGTTSNVAQQQTGTGGSYRFFMAHGLQIKFDTFNSLFLGARVEYMFGNIGTTNTLVFPDSFNAFNARHTTYNSMSGFVAGVGLQYETHFKKHTLIVGGNLTLPSNILIAQYGQWDRNINLGTIRDTIYSTKATGTMHLPTMYSVGLTWAYTNKDAEHRIRDYNKWMVGVQYDAALWQDYRFFGAPDSFRNSWKLSIGAEYRPDFAAIDNYWARVKYRFGGYMQQMPLYLAQTKLYGYAVTLGLGLPVGVNYVSEIGVGLELGTDGTTKNNLLREDFIRLHVGFTFADQWFKKRKFE